MSPRIKSKKFSLFHSKKRKKSKNKDDNPLLPILEEPIHSIKISVHWLLKIIFIILILFTIAFGYLIILVSSEPKSFKFINDKIKENIQSEIGGNFNFDDALLSFTRYGLVRIVINNTTYQQQDINNKAINNTNDISVKFDKVSVGKIDCEFSLFNIIIGKYIPSNIKITDGSAVVFYRNNKNNQDNNVANFSELEKLVQDKISHYRNVMISSNILPKNTDISNFKISLQQYQDSKNINISDTNTAIFIKNISLNRRIWYRNHKIDSKIDIHINNQIINQDLLINSQCLGYHKKTECKFDVGQIDIREIISSFTANPAILKIFTDLDSKFTIKNNFIITDLGLENIEFAINSRNSKINFFDFFKKQLSLDLLDLKGAIDIKKRKIIVKNLQAHIIDDNPDQNLFKNVQLSNNNVIINLNTELSLLENKQIKLNLKIDNFKDHNLENLWPIALGDNNIKIKQWVINNISNFTARNANLNMTLNLQPNIADVIDNLEAKFDFDNLNIALSDDLPEIENATGSAHFTKNNMLINVNEALFRSSKINNAVIAIKDFKSPDIALQINGQTSGIMADSLSFIPVSKDIHQKIAKNFTAMTKSFSEIIIPLNKEINFNNIELRIYSIVNNLKSDYIADNFLLSVNKPINSNSLSIKSDLSDAKVNLPLIIDKRQASPLFLDLDIDFAKNFTNFRKIALWQGNKRMQKINNPQELINYNFGGNIIDSKNKIIADLILSNHNKVELSQFNIKSNIDKKLELSYKKNGVNRHIINAKADELKIESIIKLINLIKNDDEKSSNNNISLKINSKKLSLFHDKNLADVAVNLDCNNNFCYNGTILANYYGQNDNKANSIIDIKINSSSPDRAKITGNVNNVGYLVDGFDLSDKISDGDFAINIDAENIGNGKMAMKGNVDLVKSITIYNSKEIKDLAKNDLFSRIKDQIFANEKLIITFSKLDFAVENNILKIESLLANNYKIGFTCKGFINIRDNSFELQGMIIPAFVINNLFGITKIPLIGGVISKTLTGGDGGGLFGIHYKYHKKTNYSDPVFTTNKISAFVPTTISSLFN